MTQPEIRFNGFSDEWVDAKLGDVLKVPEKVEATVTNNEQLLTVKLHGGGVHVMPSNKLLKLGSTKYYVRKAGQLIYGKQNFFNGSMAIIPLELDGKASSGDVPSFDIVNADTVYLYQKISQPDFYKRTEDWASGTGSKRLHEKTVQRLPIQLPTLPEQQKIGALFSKYDAIIALREQKLAELNALKKGMLQQMFDDGVTINHKPQVRFSGFNDEWVEKKLGDVTEIVMGQSPHSVNYTDNPQDYILVQGNADMKNGYVKPRVWTKEITKIVDENYLILGVRAPVGVVGRTEYPVVLGRGVAGVKGTNFLYQVLKRLKEIGYWNTMITGSTFESINSKDVKNTKIQLPTLPEQQKIGQLFKHLDARISNEQSKIEQLKAQKQGLLQKMIS